MPLIFCILVSTMLMLVVMPVLYCALYWRRMKMCVDTSLSLGKTLSTT